MPSGKGRRSRGTLSLDAFDVEVLPKREDGLVPIVVYTKGSAPRPRNAEVRKLGLFIKTSFSLRHLTAVNGMHEGRRILYRFELVYEYYEDEDLEQLVMDVISNGPRLRIACVGAAKGNWRETSRRGPKHRARRIESWGFSY